MSNKSFPSKLNTQTSYDDNRGGEKKVMKKSLSVLVATAMVSSVFASVAFAADTTLTTQQKLDALIAAGIFDKDGTGNGSELDANMSREQLAKILAKLKDLKEVSGTSYTDVAADRWSAGFIQAVSKATPPLMDGVADGVFNPSGEVTLEQLATVAVRALGLQPNNSGTVKGNVSSWAKGYVATAIANGFLGEKADFTKSAIRSELVEATYGAKQAIDAAKAPAKVSVKEAKATGVQKVQVTLDKEVDTAKATFTLKKGTTTVDLIDKKDFKWSDDKKSVTLVLKEGNKINAGTYTVTIGGLEATEIDKASVDFTAEDEKVQKLEFVSSSDTVVRSHKTRIQFQATNQYGEGASVSSGNFSVYATTPNNSGNITKDANGKLYVLLDTDFTGVVAGSSQISVNIYDNVTHMSATKIFKVGDYPYVSKVELGDVTYKNGKASLSSQGDVAVIALTQYDQYGGVITNDVTTSSGVSIPKPSAYLTPYSDALKDVGTTKALEIKDDNNDGIDDVVVTLTGKPEKSDEFTVSVFGGGSTATQKIKVGALKVASKVELVTPSNTFAYGDVDKYIELVAYDEAGNKLSADDIVDNAKDGKFKVNASGNLQFGATTDVPAAMLVQSAADPNQDNKIVLTGPNKGKIHIGKVTGKGQGNIFVSIYGIGVNSNHNINIPLNDVRYPSAIKVVTDPATKAIAGASFDSKFAVYDQYNEKMTKFSTDVDGVTPISIISNNKTVTYDVYTTINSTDPNLKVGALSNGSLLALNDFSDKTFTITTAGAAANSSINFKFEIRKREAATGSTPALTNVVDSNVASISRTVSILTADQAKNLTYSLNTVGDIFNTLDDTTYPSTDATENSPVTSKLAKELVVSAKDASGSVVALPKTVTDVTTDVYSVARVAKDGTANARKAYVLGDKVGTANVQVFFEAPDQTIKSVSGQVNVKNEANRVESIAAGSASKNFDITATTTNNRHASYYMGNLTVKNQYGNEFKSTGATGTTYDPVGDYDKYLQVRYTISSVTGVAPTLNANNTITINGKGSFVLTASAPNGKSASTTVVIY